MGIREDLRALVQLQAHELERVRIGGEMADLEARRAALREGVAAAAAVVKKAEHDVEEARQMAKRLDLELKAAEEKVRKYKDQMHNVKTNEQLWALQEEIGHAQQSVSAVETRILEQLEVADSLTAVIGEKKAALAGEKKRIDAEIADADREEAELAAAKAAEEAAVASLVGQVPGGLRKKYENIKRLRAGIGIAEVLDEVCMVCHTTVRPQLYVDTMNLVDIMQCENCKRLIYVAEPLGLEEPPAEGPPAAEPRTAAAAADTTADVAS